MPKPDILILFPVHPSYSIMTDKSVLFTVHYYGINCCCSVTRSLVHSTCTVFTLLFSLRCTKYQN